MKKLLFLLLISTTSFGQLSEGLYGTIGSSGFDLTATDSKFNTRLGVGYGITEHSLISLNFDVDKLPNLPSQASFILAADHYGLDGRFQTVTGVFVGRFSPYVNFDNYVLNEYRFLYGLRAGGAYWLTERVSVNLLSDISVRERYFNVKLGINFRLGKKDE